MTADKTDYVKLYGAAMTSQQNRQITSSSTLVSVAGSGSRFLRFRTASSHWHSMPPLSHGGQSSASIGQSR